MKEIRYRDELIAVVDGLEHVYLTEWAEELLGVFVSEPTSDERCKWIEVRTKKMLGKCWNFRVPSRYLTCSLGKKIPLKGLKNEP